ncbi:MAG TPA: Rrf2 family transcriptional regulator [Chitinophagaceae bacterium]
MYFSKSFGYALRGILYVALMNDENRKIQIEEIASRLSVPRHFLGKILRTIVKQGILSSTKGPHGGFFINNKTLSTQLITLVWLIDGTQRFDECALHFRKCNSAHPCPLHSKVVEYRDSVIGIFGETTIGDLIVGNKSDFIRSIAAR